MRRTETKTEITSHRRARSTACRFRSLPLAVLTLDSQKAGRNQIESNKEEAMKRKLSKLSQLIRIAPALSLAFMILNLVLINGVSAGRPEYEPAYVNDKTVTINAIEVSQNAP